MFCQQFLSECLENSKVLLRLSNTNLRSSSELFIKS